MRLTTTFFFFLFVFSTGSAQNYQTVYTNNTSHFSSIDATHPGRILFNTIHIDSVASSTNFDFFWNFVNLQDSVNRSCFPANRTTWIGGIITSSYMGYDVYYNSSWEVISIQFMWSPLNYTWHIYNYSNGDYIEGEITSISNETFIGITDTVKTITLTAKDSIGNTISNPLNGKQLKISKNHGWVQLLAFRYFPTDTVIHTLAGLENESAGIQNLTARDIFDFDIGDEFHYDDFQQTSAPVWARHRSIDRVLSKNYSSGNDTVYYTIDRCARHEFQNFSTYNVYASHDTLIDAYQLTSSSLDDYSWQFHTPNGFGDGYLDFYKDTTYYGRVKKQTHYYYTQTGPNSCYEMAVGFCVFQDRTYAKGLGWIWENDITCSSGGLVYYKKGSEEWGTPLSCSVLMSNESITFKNNLISVYPNPTPSNSPITFTFPISTLNRELLIHDITGKEITRYSLPANSTTQQIHLPQMHAGLYVARMSGGGGEGMVKFVVE
jgi:hypothetical protein